MGLTSRERKPLVFCEMWLEMRNEDNAFRVVLLAPVGVEIPEEYRRDGERDMLTQKTFYVSPWFARISDAEKSMNQVAKFYGERSVRFLVFREIRPPRSAQKSG